MDFVFENSFRVTENWDDNIVSLYHTASFPHWHLISLWYVCHN